MSDAVRIEETPLPGIGVRHDFATASGRRLGVVSHRGGQRDVVLYDREDPDACSESVALTTEEADALAEVLGTPWLVQRLAAIHEQVAALVTSELRIPTGSRFDGVPLGATQARTRTGVSIVAVVRDGAAVPSPGPAFQFLGEDTLIVVGTSEGIAALAEILTS